MPESPFPPPGNFQTENPVTVGGDQGKQCDIYADNRQRLTGKRFDPGQDEEANAEESPASDVHALIPLAAAELICDTHTLLITHPLSMTRITSRGM